MKNRIFSLATVLTAALTFPAHSSEVILRVQQAGVPEWTFPIAISADGNRILFTSDDAALTPGGIRHLYVHDRNEGTNTLIDVDHNGVPRSMFNPERAKMSDNGEFVVFVSYDALVSDDENNDYDLFLRDLEAKTTTRVSLDAVGDEVFPNPLNATPDPISYIGADVSDDGKRIVFAATADQFFPTGENNFSGIFLRDLDADTLTLISVGADPSQEPGGRCEDPVISADGKMIAFTSWASNLITGDNNAVADIFLKDLEADTLSLISQSATGVSSNSNSTTPSITADGTKIAFLSGSTNLIDGETISELGLYVYDTETSGISLGSRQVSGDPVEGFTNGSISSNGQYLTILSTAANVIPGDLRDRFSPADPSADFSPFVYLLDRETGQIGRSQRTESGDEPEVGIWEKAYAADNGDVVYATTSAEIVTPDSLGTLDIFVTPASERVFVNTAGVARRVAAAVKAALAAKYEAQAQKLKKQIKAAKKKKSKTKAKKLLKQLKALNAKISAL